MTSKATSFKLDVVALLVCGDKAVMSVSLSTEIPEVWPAGSLVVNRLEEEAVRAVCLPVELEPRPPLK